MTCSVDGKVGLGPGPDDTHGVFVVGRAGANERYVMAGIRTRLGDMVVTDDGRNIRLSTALHLGDERTCAVLVDALDEMAKAFSEFVTGRRAAFHARMRVHEDACAALRADHAREQGSAIETCRADIRNFVTQVLRGVAP